MMIQNWCPMHDMRGRAVREGIRAHAAHGVDGGWSIENEGETIKGNLSGPDGTCACLLQGKARGRTDMCVGTNLLGKGLEAWIPTYAALIDLPCGSTL